MFRRAALIKPLAYRAFSLSNQCKHKVAIWGANGGIGQPLSLLMMRNRLVTTLGLYDLNPTVGNCTDLSHIDTNTVTIGCKSKNDIDAVLKDADVVLCTAGVPRKPGMTRADLFTVNANIIMEVTCKLAEICPTALIAIVTNPINSVLPVVAETFKQKGCFDPNRLFGVTTLDIVRARKFMAQESKVQADDIDVDVIGGHSDTTMIPVLSQARPAYKGDKIEKISTRVRVGGTEVVKAKAGLGSATFSTAHAIEQFTTSLLRALDGEKDIVECAYVESCVTNASYFSTPLLLGKKGIKENLGLPKLSPYEQKLFDKAVPLLEADIKLGTDFVEDLIT